jgi:hypothetical protein
VEREPSFRTVAAILRRKDPLALLSAGLENADEYDSEARLIAGRLNRCSSATECRAVIWDVFRQQFGAEAAGVESDWQDLAQEVWTATRIHFAP